MDRKKPYHAMPGYIAVGLVSITTVLWTFWGVAEMYYEGWGQPFPDPLAYTIPGVMCLTLALAAVAFPRVGGVCLILIGALFTFWWVALQLGRGAGFWGILSLFPVSAMLVLTGVLFVIDGRRRHRRRTELLHEGGTVEQLSWWKRNMRFVVVVGSFLLTVIVTSAFNLPVVLGRHNDGYLGARVIEGNGVTLVWAPHGPGWNWKQDFGGYPSWNSLALYGLEPIGLDWHGKLDSDTLNASRQQMDSCGLCAYLNAAGDSLLDSAVYIWRMPTTDEIVRSLCIDGHHAGCSWDGESKSAQCEVVPDKETPLWNPNEQPVYYWTADEYDNGNARFVNYNGNGISRQPKGWGNPRHGYRCVRELMAGETWDSIGRPLPPPGKVDDSDRTDAYHTP